MNEEQFNAVHNAVSTLVCHQLELFAANAVAQPCDGYAKKAFIKGCDIYIKLSADLARASDECVDELKKVIIEQWSTRLKNILSEEKINEMIELIKSSEAWNHTSTDSTEK